MVCKKCRILLTSHYDSLTPPLPVKTFDKLLIWHTFSNEATKEQLLTLAYTHLPIKVIFFIKQTMYVSIPQNEIQIRMTKGGATSWNQNKWSTKERKNVINFIWIFLCHVKRIQLWNRHRNGRLEEALRRFLRSSLISFSNQSVFEAFSDFHGGSNVTLFRTYFDLGSGSNVCPTKRSFRYGLEWINNAGTMWSWHRKLGILIEIFCRKLSYFSVIHAQKGFMGE